jgi:hypothetical protein
MSLSRDGKDEQAAAANHHCLLTKNPTVSYLLCLPRRRAAMAADDLT